MTTGIDGERLLARLSQLALIGASPQGGITRLAWTAEMATATDLVGRWAEQAGATVRLDGVGNLIAELPGTEDLPPLVTGSHLDTVIGGGALDGAYGVVAAVEVLAGLSESGRPLRHPLRAIAFANEEGVMAPPYTGSRAIAGRLGPDELDAVGPDGRSLRARLADRGLETAGVTAAAWNTAVAGVVELHIEQGPVLDTEGLDIGVVTAITGQRRGSIAIEGETNHAGTTPMSLRRDAVVAAAHLVLAVEELARSGPLEVATVGRLDARPGVANVIAGAVEMSYDLRSTDDPGTADAYRELLAVAVAIEARWGVRVEVTPLPPAPAVATDPGLQKAITEAAQRLGLRSRPMVSGAGHDCAMVADLGPVAMIFVPSSGGISHDGREDTPPSGLVAGARVLAEALRIADEELD